MPRTEKLTDEEIDSYAEELWQDRDSNSGPGFTYDVLFGDLSGYEEFVEKTKNIIINKK
jgi:hypothetical protein